MSDNSGAPKSLKLRHYAVTVTVGSKAPDFCKFPEQGIIIWEQNHTMR